MRVLSRSLIVAALMVPASACSNATGTENQPVTPTGERSAAELEAIFRARTDSARMRFTQADVDFMMGMIHHHAQALHMARLAPERASSPAIRTLAARVINGQLDEITSMQKWLRDRGLPAPELHMTDDSVMIHGAGRAHHAMAMPGMLSAAQIAQLERAGGAAFDRLFLELLIQHHRGAVTMVNELVATDGALQDEDAFRLAADIQVDQATEIARMERMLAAMPAGMP